MQKATCAQLVFSHNYDLHYLGLDKLCFTTSPNTTKRFSGTFQLLIIIIIIIIIGLITLSITVLTSIF